MLLNYIPLHYTDPISDWQNNGLNSAFDYVSLAKCLQRYVNETDLALVKLWTMCDLVPECRVCMLVC